ncbi:MAG: DUF488 family protein [Gammaproteobacteria bacterium]|nr:DUF488 family protein [Gammaproteobacteria bacterium]
MKTASFFSYSGPGRISIARYASRGLQGYRTYKALAPRQDMLRMPYDEYRTEYFKILSDLDPAQVAEDLAALAAPHEPILLCWERPPLTEKNWCHRTMVAQWLERSLGMRVPEIKS